MALILKHAWASQGRSVGVGLSGHGRGLGEMTRRKREIIGLRNERDFPYLVELALSPEGFRSVFLEIDALRVSRPARPGSSF